MLKRLLFRTLFRGFIFYKHKTPDTYTGTRTGTFAGTLWFILYEINIHIWSNLHPQKLPQKYQIIQDI